MVSTKNYSVNHRDNKCINLLVTFIIPRELDMVLNRILNFVSEYQCVWLLYSFSLIFITKYVSLNITASDLNNDINLDHKYILYDVQIINAIENTLPLEIFCCKHILMKCLLVNTVLCTFKHSYIQRSTCFHSYILWMLSVLFIFLTFPWTITFF